MFRGWRLCAGVLIVVVACVGLVSAQEKPLDNAELVRLTKLDMGDQVIVAKIKASKDVNFDISTDALIKLKEAGVSKPVLAAMLERMTPAAAPAAPKASGTQQPVTLYANGGSIELTAVYGQLKSQSSPFGVTQWVQFNDPSAKLRVTDRRPSVVIATDIDPRGAWWLVSLSTAKDGNGVYRYFDLERGGGVFSMAWSGSPEQGSIVKFDVVQEQPGKWRLTVPKDLKPGEYGVFSGRNQGEGILFGFGIDK